MSGSVEVTVEQVAVRMEVEPAIVTLGVNAGLPSVGIFTLAVDAADRVVAGTGEDGVVRTVEPKAATVGPRSHGRCDLG